MSNEKTKLDYAHSSNQVRIVSKESLNELQNSLSQAIESYKKNGGKNSTIKIYDQSGRSRRVSTKKKITTIKKRKFIPYGMENQEISAESRNRKGRRSKNNNELTTQDDDGYDTDRMTQSSDAGEKQLNQNTLNREILIEEEEEYDELSTEDENSIQQSKYRSGNLRERMDAVAQLLAKMEGDLNEVDDYDFSDE